MIAKVWKNPDGWFAPPQRPATASAPASLPARQVCRFDKRRPARMRTDKDAVIATGGGRGSFARLVACDLRGRAAPLSWSPAAEGPAREAPAGDGDGIRDPDRAAAG
jgi:hypothetical protein